MKDRDFDELAGRIEAVARMGMILAATLEDKGLINGPVFSQALRDTLRPASDDPAHLKAARVTLNELANSLDAARNSRQLKREWQESQTHPASPDHSGAG